MKATEQFFPVVLFIMLYKVFLTFESVNEILKCDDSNESYGAVRFGGAVYYAIKVVQTKPWNRDLQYGLTKVVARDLT